MPRRQRLLRSLAMSLAVVLVTVVAGLLTRDVVVWGSFGGVAVPFLAFFWTLGIQPTKAPRVFAVTAGALLGLAFVTFLIILLLAPSN